MRALLLDPRVAPTIRRFLEIVIPGGWSTMYEADNQTADGKHVKAVIITSPVHIATDRCVVLTSVLDESIAIGQMHGPACPFTLDILRGETLAPGEQLPDGAMQCPEFQTAHIRLTLPVPVRVPDGWEASFLLHRTLGPVSDN